MILKREFGNILTLSQNFSSVNTIYYEIKSFSIRKAMIAMAQQFQGDKPRGFSSRKVSTDLDVSKQSLDHNKPTLDVSKQSLDHSKPTSDISSQLSKEAQEERRELLARAA